MNHTKMRLTYQIGEYTGDNWLVAVVDFGTQPNGENARGYVTTNHVHASELEYGNPADDLQLWTSAPELLEALENLVDLCEAGDGSEEHQQYEPQEMKAARAAIAKAKGER